MRVFLGGVVVYESPIVAFVGMGANPEGFCWRPPGLKQQSGDKLTLKWDPPWCNDVFC